MGGTHQEAGVEAPVSSPDRVATFTIVTVGVVALLCSWILPWWAMEARAPQYGQRVLIVQVNPKNVGGDIQEIDALGHYVGIRPIASVANLERKLGPIGLTAAFLGFLIAPFLKKRWLRFLMVVPTILMPVIFLADLKYWVSKSATERDPEASLNLTVTDINTKILGKYEVGQFKVSNSIQGGVYVAGLAGALGLGLVFAVPIPLPRRRKKGTPLAMAGLLFALAPGLGHAATLQEQIDQASEGATIRIPAGVHREHLIIGKRLTLIGDGESIIDGENRGTVLTISGSGTVVRDLIIRNSGDSYLMEDSGIRIDDAKDVQVSGTKIQDTLFGLFVVKGDGCRIEGNQVIGKDLPTERRGDGIRLWYSHGCHMAGNTLDRSRDFIIWYSNDTRVENNAVTHSRYGLHYMYSDRNTFRNNRFEENQVGAAVMYSKDVELSGNAFSFSHGVAAYGLLLKDTDDIFIRGNRFVYNATALFFDNSPQSLNARLEVRGNLIARNEVGVTVQPNTRNIEFYENAFIGNQTQVSVAGAGTAQNNHWSVNSRGNYWSDAMLYDREGDGVSEIPYRVEATFEVLSDRYPALKFFDQTLSSQAIDMAARIFPIFAPRQKLVDPFPLTRPILDDFLSRRDSKAKDTAMPLVGATLLTTTALGVALARKVVS